MTSPILFFVFMVVWLYGSYIAVRSIIRYPQLICKKKWEVYVMVPFAFVFSWVFIVFAMAEFTRRCRGIDNAFEDIMESEEKENGYE